LNKVQLQSKNEMLANGLVESSGHERHIVSLNEYSFSLHGEHSFPFPIYPGLQWHS